MSSIRTEQIPARVQVERRSRTAIHYRYLAPPASASGGVGTLYFGAAPR